MAGYGESGHCDRSTLNAYFYTSPDGTHFSRNCRITDKALDLQSGHAHLMSCIQCELANLLLESMPPDPDLVDLIEQAFLEGQI